MWVFIFPEVEERMLPTAGGSCPKIRVAEETRSLQMPDHLLFAVRPKLSMCPIIVEFRNELNLFASRVRKSVDVEDIDEK